MKRIIMAVLASLAMIFACVLAASPAVALGKVKCDVGLSGDVTVFRGSVDPIVNHNQATSSHEHQFFGSYGWQATKGNAANYNDLRTSPTRCRVAADTAGYWTPTLKYISGPKAGQTVPVQQFTAYYRGWNGQTTDAGSQAFPADTRLVGPDDFGKGAHGWNCGQFSRQAAAQGTVGYIPDCSGEDGSPGNTLTAHINFPSCWDGVLPNHLSTDVGNTADSVAHYRYPSGTSCPAGFPKHVTQLRETIQFMYVGNGTDVRLSSDMTGQKNGESMHGDFFNAWDQTKFVAFIQNCVQTSADASCDP